MGNTQTKNPTEDEYRCLSNDELIKHIEYELRYKYNQGLTIFPNSPIGGIRLCSLAVREYVLRYKNGKLLPTTGIVEMVNKFNRPYTLDMTYDCIIVQFILNMPSLNTPTQSNDVPIQLEVRDVKNS